MSVGRLGFASVLILLLAACSAAGEDASTAFRNEADTRTRSCAADGRVEVADRQEPDYAQFIRHDGRLYTADYPPTSGSPGFGRELGVVTCRLAGSSTPQDYSASRDGEASFLDEGTPYYEVHGHSPDEAIGAYYDDVPLVFFWGLREG